MAIRERLGDLREAVEQRTGYTTVRTDRLQILEGRSEELGYTRRELDALAWTALDYVGGSPQEMKAVERRKLAQKARIIWMKDAMAGAAVDLMNDFVFGRGLPKPKAADSLVQEVIDEAWADPDNELVLTTYQSQLALGTDLSLQANIFVLVFDDGDDGKVKLGLLEHDAVENAVRDPDNRLRVLYFVARHYRQEWDYEHDGPDMDLRGRGPADAARGDNGKGEIRYYEHWRNVQDARDDADAGVRELPKLCPDNKLGEGKVFHIAVNRTTEMAFGHPLFDRLINWFNAYNTFMDARMDILQAKAAFVMKRKIKGTPNQLQKMAQQAVSRRSALGAAVQDPDMALGPRPASILNENENVTHEELSLDTGSQAAMADGQMLRSPISAATRFPQTYYGDASNSNLATATSLELPVLKAVEARQEFFEALVRFFTDRVIERAVDSGRISKDLTAEERAKLEADKAPDHQAGQEMPGDPNAQNGAVQTGAPTSMGAPGLALNMALREAHEGQGQDENDTARDLSYEFQMPSPLKRMMTDLVTSVMNIAKTFDPNNTNMELSRVLLGVVLGDALEMEDPQKWVEKIFPEGYVDPAVAAAQAMQVDPNAAPPPDPRFGEFGPQPQTGTQGADGQRHGAANPYGAPMQASPPGQMQQSLAEAVVTLGRDGEPLYWPRPRLQEHRVQDMPADVRALAADRAQQVASLFDDAFAAIPSANGNGKHP